MKKFVYSFQEGRADMQSLLGGKGANLAEMTRIGLPVPDGFTITTEACNEYYQREKTLWDELNEEIIKHLNQLQDRTGKKLGSIDDPLLVSVRSGGSISMPGMMDTILNLGLNDASTKGLANATGNPRFAYDSYRRFIQMFGEVVLQIAKYKFDNIFENKKTERNVVEDTQLKAEDLQDVVDKYKELVKKEAKIDFPQDVREQLFMAVEAVFKSWGNPRAKIYRELHDIPDSLGTAVNIQLMVFGNMGDSSGTGVVFTRNPSTGEKELFGEFLLNAQGEDVVAGIRTPGPIEDLGNKMPEIYDEFKGIAQLLEKHYRDMQDIEFTIENEKLYILQTRNGKRTALSAVNIAVDMYKEGIFTKEEAVMKIDPLQLEQLLHPTFKEEELDKAVIIGEGLPASSGAATGRVYFSPDDVVEAKKRGERAILVRMETSPEDIEGMVAAEGILTTRGGMTSHAAVVARGMGKCCVAGAGEIRINETAKTFTARDKEYKEGDYISLEGARGVVYEGQIDTEEPELSDKFVEFMEWADEIRELEIRTNADTEKDAKQAIDFGAEGIGLCRTEHMFFEGPRIFVMRRMILARKQEERRKALNELLPMQREDFIKIFAAMGDKPVTIRLLDPPLHEFLPHTQDDLRQLAESMEVPFEQLAAVANDLTETNPMLGHRGCRLAVTYPEIYEMQVRAIIEAAVSVQESEGLQVIPEIMIPLIGEFKELVYIKELVQKTIDETLEEKNSKLKYLIGTMIEIPRAAITADEIATEAEFFSFGTNDLTQMAFGYSRDDAGKFINEYREKNILDKDPFQSIDRKGVGKLMEMAVELGRKGRPDIKLGICGEHGGEPNSIEFCHILGLDYVSCSPYRVPVARLAAAQAQIRLPR